MLVFRIMFFWVFSDTGKRTCFFLLSFEFEALFLMGIEVSKLMLGI